MNHQVEFIIFFVWYTFYSLLVSASKQAEPTKLIYGEAKPLSSTSGGLSLISQWNIDRGKNLIDSWDQYLHLCLPVNE